jgi:hypothetical protein
MGESVGRRRSRLPGSERKAMSAIPIGGGIRGADRAAVARAAAEWLSLAAAPTFAVMALSTAVLGGGAAPLCMAEHGAVMSGMAPMYALMSAFHVAPWLRMISGLRSGDPSRRL